MEANAKQTQSFLNATGVSMADMALLIAGLVVVAFMLWSAWVTLSYYQQWASKKNDVTFYDVIASAVRAAVLLSLIIFIVS
ncbi:TIGR03758 family integrating conjugative element protein [Methylophaga sp.]|jgi:integrating conjugative element protein (TIGR03758 family)|uniref:TIGR03758 family integrating conjugative element protein n=1 Tax=Methylophaga sp. TaxID=2024840 RepID=UPI000C0F648E|nr:TIGR03758 family integrating conjugative element protein [Methylophaga sp.]MBL1456462.1 TIGR03758 family integrating conjugative element protein [Methylophaga sp.]MBN45388.1 TIGR03758 family integrating conjugative element protein [Methylophaga sp.]|tara:strand:- start:38797 stop:39039 length:243 start_codon:yes stop_codon:yes gene_type:complete